MEMPDACTKATLCLRLLEVGCALPPRPSRPPAHSTRDGLRPRGGARHFAAVSPAAPGARGPLNCSQNGWHLDQLICKTGVNHLIRGPHAGRGAEAFAMQRGRGPRRVFIWGNGNQEAHKAAPPAAAPRPPSGGDAGARRDLRPELADGSRSLGSPQALQPGSCAPSILARSLPGW